MHVTHIISSIHPSSGGPTSALLGLARAQVQAGLQVAVAATWGGAAIPETAQTLRSFGVQVTMIGPTWGRLAAHSSLGPVLREKLAATDVVHIHGLWESIHHEAAQAARALGKPYIFRPCGMLDPWSLRQHGLRKRVYLAWRLRRDLNGAAALHFTADLERDLAAPLGLRPPALVVANGVNLEEFAVVPPRGFLRGKYPAIGARPLVVFLSRVHPKKGLDLLITALSRMQQGQAMLAIVGPGDDSYIHELHNLVRTYQLEQRVIFVGPLYGPQRIAALADADLFVLPSHQENFGIAVVEALAAGTPVVISDQVNICREIARAGVGGVVPLEVSALAGEIDRWLTDPALRSDITARARQFVWERYDWNHIARQWAERYATLVH